MTPSSASSAFVEGVGTFFFFFVFFCIFGTLQFLPRVHILVSKAALLGRQSKIRLLPVHNKYNYGNSTIDRKTLYSLVYISHHSKYLPSSIKKSSPITMQSLNDQKKIPRIVKSKQLKENKPINTHKK